MLKLVGNKRLLLLLLSLVVFIVIMGLTFGKRDALSWPEKFIKDTVSWTQGLFIQPARYIAGFFEDIRRLRLTYEENKVLRSRLSQYAADTMKLNALEGQNNDLKQLLAFTDQQKNADRYTYRVAEILAYSPNPYSNLVNINLGAKDGMRENMAVISTEGLIGRINRVTPFHSTVQLLNDIDDTSNNSLPNSKAIAATVKGKEFSFGIIEKYDSFEEKLLMTKIQSNPVMKVGDVIITSGLGHVFPPGIVIGKVSSVSEGDFGINQKAMIEPAANFHRLRYVMVVAVPETR